MCQNTRVYIAVTKELKRVVFVLCKKTIDISVMRCMILMFFNAIHHIITTLHIWQLALWKRVCEIRN